MQRQQCSMQRGSTPRTPQSMFNQMEKPLPQCGESMIYINYQYECEPIETIWEGKSRKEARRMPGEYTYGGHYQGRYWISTRATKDYYNQNKGGK